MILASGPEVPTQEIGQPAAMESELAIFGSAARTDMGPDSDVDLMIDFFPATQYGWDEYLAIEDALIRLLGRRVDLGIKRWMKPQVRARISKEGKVIYAA